MTAHFFSIHLPRRLRRSVGGPGSSRPGTQLVPIVVVVVGSLLAGVIRIAGTDIPASTAVSRASVVQPAMIGAGQTRFVEPASLIDPPDATAEAAST